MENSAIADFLEDMATLLELSNANRFRVNAFRNGARTIQSLDQSVVALVESGELTSIKGIGKGLADTIAELVTTGNVADYEKLKADIPAGLLEMIRIPGFGSKKARVVWQELNLTTIDELEAACKADQLKDLKGFGKKTQDKILEGIVALRKYADRFHIHKTQETADGILAKLKELPNIHRIEVAGSLRRRNETCKDIDILVSTSNPEAAMETFVSLSDIDTVIVNGPTKSSIRLTCGQNVDLRVVTDEQFPFALHYFTGSKEHNTLLRSRAKKYGLKLNEYGLFRDDETSGSCADETAIFKALDLRFIEPELREGLGEIDAAEKDELPDLVTLDNIRGILHCHSTYSDGKNSLADMANAVREKGFGYFGITDHSKTAVYASGLSIEQIQKQHAEIDRLNESWTDFRILKGIESDILSDGSLDYTDEVLSSFDFIVSSVHSQFNLSEADQTARMIKAIENPHTTILGHLTGRLLLSRDGYKVDVHKLIDACAANNVIIEINASPYRLELDWRLLRTAVAKGCKIAVNPDAHSIRGLDVMRFGIGIARKGWLTKEHVVNCLSCEGFLELIKR